MPASIRGQWHITRILPTKNSPCWEEEKAKTLVGSNLSYAAMHMIWHGGIVQIPQALTRTLTQRQFEGEYKVALADLGISAPSVTEIDLQHEDADVTGTTTEVPGDTILLAGPGRIVVSACGVFYSAVRVGAGH